MEYKLLMHSIGQVGQNSVNIDQFRFEEGLEVLVSLYDLPAMAGSITTTYKEG